MSDENSTPNTQSTNTPNANTPASTPSNTPADNAAKTPPNNQGSSAGKAQLNAGDGSRSNSPNAAPNAAPNAGDASTGSDGEAGASGGPRSNAPLLNPDGTPRPRRRRGSRGGKNRKRTPGTGQGGQGGQAQGQSQGASSSDEVEQSSGGDDYTDAAADRGLTTEDVAAKAASEAGIDLASDGGLAPAKSPSPKASSPKAPVRPSSEVSTLAAAPVPTAPETPSGVPEQASVAPFPEAEPVAAAESAPQVVAQSVEPASEEAPTASTSTPSIPSTSTPSTSTSTPSTDPVPETETAAATAPVAGADQGEQSEPARPKIGDSRPAPVLPASATQDASPSRAPSNNPQKRTPSKNAQSNKTASTAQGESAASDDTNTEGGAPSGAAKKRRKRGGRGRSRTGGAAGAQGVGGATGGGIADLGPASDLDDLDEAVRERRRGRSRQGRATGRYTMGVHKAADGGVHLAVLEGRVLTEHYVSRETDDDTSIDGNIYLGRVQNVLPGMEAAFIDISTPKNGVLYRGDVSFDAGEVENQEPRIESLLKNGQMVIVQVTKNPIGAKGARLTQEVSLAGRFVVMVPGQPQTYGISKRLPDEERRRLRKVLDAIRPDDAGLIVRTAAAGASAEELERDLNRLKAEWQVIAAAAKRSGKPCLLHREPPLVVRVIREEFNTEYRSIVIDDEVLYNEVRSYVEAIAPELAERVELHVDAPGELPLFERLHIHEQLHKALERKVWLPSGGSLIIERTEALTVIDVNTGKNVGRSNLEETVFQNNLEAAAEVAHQLRLRDIGGIIVIDFIDMEVKRNRDEVVRVLRDALARDKTRTQVFEISELGLVEMTRKRISEGLVESFSEVCPTCAGRGFTVDQSML